MSMCDEAIEYTKLGLAVFPIRYKDKTPLTEHGFKDASKDPAQIHEWWKRWPNANIGIATGQISEGIYVIDLDVDDDRGIDGYHVLKDWERDNEVFPDSWIAITGRGGYHLYFKSSQPIDCHTGILDGVDIRGNGGYVVAPPSTHKNGKQYEWEYAPGDILIANADDQLNKLLQSAKTLHRPDAKFRLPEVISKGKRNSTLFKAACSYQSNGMPDVAIMGAVMALNQENCETPLPQDEVKALVESALKYDKGKSNKPEKPSEISKIEKAHLQYDDKGKLIQSSANIVEAIEHDPGLVSAVRFNVLAYAPYIQGKLPWRNEEENREWTNFDDNNLYTYIEDTYKLTIRAKMAEAFSVVMSNRMFNPICEKMDDIYRNQWDHKVGHIENLFSDYLGVEKSSYSVECMQLLMLGALNRAFDPGCKFDYMVVLVGPQGIGKSTFFRYLALEPNWYNDNFNTIDGDKACEKLRGFWIVEMAELLATKRAKDVEAIKSFITSTTDSYRPPYERRTENRPRMCVFVGTTNNQRFLTDRTGNRRFLPIVARAEHVKKSLFDNPEDVRKDFINAWGEAMDIFLRDGKGEHLVLSGESAKYASMMQDTFTEEDSNVGIIQEWLDSHTEVNRVCASMIYKEALGNLGVPTRMETNNLLTIMDTSIDGWKRMEKREKCKNYGRAICYERCQAIDDALDGFDTDLTDKEIPFD